MSASAVLAPTSSVFTKSDLVSQIRAAINDCPKEPVTFPCPGPHRSDEQATLTITCYDAYGDPCPSVRVRCNGARHQEGCRCKQADLLKLLGVTQADLRGDWLPEYRTDPGTDEAPDPAGCHDDGNPDDWEPCRVANPCQVCGRANQGCSEHAGGQSWVCFCCEGDAEYDGIKGVRRVVTKPGDMEGRTYWVFTKPDPRLKRPGKPKPDLAPRHVADLKKSGLTDATIKAAGLHTLTGRRLGRLLRWKGDAEELGQALVFPYRHPATGVNGYARVKPDARRHDKDGKEIKYEAQLGGGHRVFFPPGFPPAALTDTAVSLVLVEGEKKALKGQQEGFNVLGLPGVEAWSVRREVGPDGNKVGPRELIPDLAGVAWGGRTVHVCFDSDRGTNPKIRRAEKALAGKLASLGAKVFIIHLPGGPEGKVGLDDFFVSLERKGEDARAAFRRLMEQATPAATTGPAAPKKSDGLVDLVGGAELFHDGQRRAYLAVEVDGHRETMEVGSEGCRLWLARESHRAGLGVPSEMVLKETEGALKGKALFDGPEREVFLRVGRHKNAIYLDLGDRTWRAVKITKDGWKVVKKPKVYFRRTPGLLPLPLPQKGGDLTRLRTLFSLDDDRNYRLSMSWLLGTLMPQGPYPILAVTGEQGTAKSCVCRGLRYLVDPNSSPLGNKPREERSLGVKALGNHVVTFDNLSCVPDWLSDALCRVATGAGFSDRKHYSNDEEFTFNVCRPILLNGIASEMLGRPDLLDRALLIELPVIPEEARKPEADFWRELEAARPRLLGALLDAAAEGLKNLPDIRLARLPRMADFARWVEACGPALGLKPGEFVETLEEVRDEADAQTLGNWPVYPILSRFLKDRWEGLVSDLDAKLEEARHDPLKRVPDRVRYSADWPKTSGVLSAQLKRHAPALRRAGIAVTWPRRGRHGQPVCLERVAPANGVQRV